MYLYKEGKYIMRFFPLRLLNNFLFIPISIKKTLRLSTFFAERNGIREKYVKSKSNGQDHMKNYLIYKVYSAFRFAEATLSFSHKKDNMPCVTNNTHKTDQLCPPRMIIYSY
jgi:hypothetical protein